MDCSNGHLVRDINLLSESDRARYSPVPSHLIEDATRTLDGQAETTINLNTQSNLAAWAANVRKRSRARAKIAKRSRAKNRK